VKHLLRSLILALLAGTTAIAQPLPDGAAACIDALEAARADGDDTDDKKPLLARICPDFSAALAATQWNALLEADNLDPAGLEALTSLASRYQAPVAERLAVDPLGAIVAELEPFVPDEKPSLWSRFSDWINGLFEADDGEESWLSAWLNSFSLSELSTDSFVRIIAFVAVLAVLAILLNELRLSGAFISSRRRVRGLAGTARDTAVEVPVSLDAVLEATTIRRRIELLLTLVISRLQRQHGTALHVGKTHGELASAAGQLDPDLQEPFASIVRAAERVTYADREPDPAEFERVLESGRAVVARTDTTPGSTA
jgi:hypothetical protein